MNTKQLKEFLVADPAIQKIVMERSGVLDLEDEDLEPYEIAEIYNILVDGRDPKKWKRFRKFTVGSKADGLFRDHFPEWTGATARVFCLEGSSIAICLIVEDNELIGVEDLSD